VERWEHASFTDRGDKVTVYYPVETPGNKIMRPGLKFKVEGTPLEKFDFISLMLALFFGTAALPHIRDEKHGAGPVGKMLHDEPA